MSCTGCNDGCFDESVQLAQGPTGPAGNNGADGNGIDTVVDNGIFDGHTWANMDIGANNAGFDVSVFGNIDRGHDGEVFGIAAVDGVWG